MRSVNEQFKKLKACPFCGKKPEVLEYDVSTDGYATMTLRCCMIFNLESSLMCFNGIDEYGRNKTVSFVEKNPIDIWNTRVPKRKYVKRKGENKK